jgi:uncharacterized protein (TIGR02001 family)
VAQLHDAEIRKQLLLNMFFNLAQILLLERSNSIHLIGREQHMKTFLCTSLITTLLLGTGVAQAEWSANAGFASDYYYRGIFQHNSSPSGGLDFESGSLYAGTWVADVGDGLEIDGYFGYAAVVGYVYLSIGFTC